MRFNRIKRYTQKQFDHQLQIEGKEITNYYSGAKTKALFRTPSATTTQRKVDIYVRQDAGFSKGDIFVYGGQNYLIMSINSIESEVYYVCNAIYCTALLNVKGNKIPFVVGDLGSPMAKNGTGFGTDVGGNITLVTKDTEVSRSMKNAVYREFGGNYKVINYFYNDGICYIYVARTDDFQSTDPYQIEYFGKGTFKISEGTVPLKFCVTNGRNHAVISDAELTYEISNTTFAIVDDDGNITPKRQGTAQITVRCEEFDISAVLGIVVVDK